MMSEYYNPHDWLKKLNQAIMSTKCKSNNKEISLEEGCYAAGKMINHVIESNATVWWVGNGGSAAICSHLSQDMFNKLDAKSFYQGDASLMTCMANDFGYENVYVRFLERLSSKNDLIIAISSSGNSENILLCAKMASERNIDLITFSGFKDCNQLWNSKSNLSFWVPMNLFGIVELSHEAILHGIIESLWLDKMNR